MQLKYVLWAYIVFIHDMYKIVPLKNASTVIGKKMKEKKTKLSKLQPPYKLVFSL